MTEPIFLFSNNAGTTIRSALTPSDTEIVLAVGTGGLFPSPGDGEAVQCTLGTGAVLEIVQVTARSGDVLTVVRGREGTTGLPWAAGSAFKELVTRGVIQSLIQWSQLGIPRMTVDLGDAGGTAEIDISDMRVGTPMLLINMTAGAACELSDIIGANEDLGVSIMLSVLEGSSDISIPLDTPPFLLSNNAGPYGFPGYPLSSITFMFNPENTDYKWVEQSRTWRVS